MFSQHQSDAAHLLTATKQQILEFFPDSKSSQTTVYKIQKSDGSWEFTNSVTDNDSQILNQRNYTSDTNIIPSRKDTTESNSKNLTSSPENTKPLLPPSPYSDPDKVTELIRDAKNLQNVFTERQEHMNQTIDGH